MVKCNVIYKLIFKLHSLIYINLNLGQTIYAGDLNDFELIQQELNWIEQENALIQ